MIMEIFTASGTTKTSGAVGLLTGLPTAAGAIATGEWTAVAVGAAITGIAGVFAVIGFLHDKQIAALHKEIADLIEDGREQRTRRKAAEEMSDTWERRLHRLEGQIGESAERTPPDGYKAPQQP